MDTTPWITVGIVADIEPSGSWADVASTVVTSVLTRRLGDAAVTTYTCRSPRSLELDPAPWRSLDQLRVDAPSVVIACGDTARNAADRSAGVVVEGPELDRDSGVAALLPGLFDPVALDVRRRMLLHLGVVPGGEYVLDDDLLTSTQACFPLRPADMHVLATGAMSIECSDWLLRALAGDADTSAGSALLESWVRQVLDVRPDAVTDRLAALTRENERLRTALDSERTQHAAELEHLLPGRTSTR